MNGGKSLVCVYARGYDPRQGDVWDACRNAVGGDDFVEALELSDQQLRILLAGGSLAVEAGDDYWRVTAIGGQS